MSSNELFHHLSTGKNQNQNQGQGENQGEGNGWSMEERIQYGTKKVELEKKIKEQITQLYSFTTNLARRYLQNDTTTTIMSLSFTSMT